MIIKWFGILALLVTSLGCASGPPTYGEMVGHQLYKHVRAEKTPYILRGDCEIGMNAFECIIAWKGDYFEPISKSENKDGFYDIYRVSHGGKRVYLHFQDLILVRIAEYEYRR